MGNPALETLEYAEGLYRLYQDAKTRHMIQKIRSAEGFDEALEIYRQTHGYKIGFNIFALTDKIKLVRRIEEIQYDLKTLGIGWPPPSKEVNEYIFNYSKNP